MKPKDRRGTHEVIDAERTRRPENAQGRADVSSGGAQSDPVTATAHLVVSDVEAYVAVSTERRPLGPNGEPRIAKILHTDDGGRTWLALHWHRSVFSRLRYPGFPNWPPEAVLSLARESTGLVVQHRDEHVLFEPGGESLWESRLQEGKWSLRRLRRMDYEGRDQPAPVPGYTLALPRSIVPPVLRT